MKKKNLKKIAVMIVYWCAVLGIMILAVGITINGAKFAYQIGYNIFYDVPSDEDSDEEIVVTVPEGCTVQVMAEALEEEGIIRDSFIFCIQAKLYGYELIPGEHVICPTMTNREIMKALSVLEIEEES